MKDYPQTTADGFPRPEGDTHLPCSEGGGLPGLLDCMHCGLCLQSCPTYVVTGLETDSPRGRLALLRAEMENRIDAAAIAPALNRCVQCRACEVACPSDVPYHSLLQAFQARHPNPKITRRLNTWIGSARRQRSAAALARFARRTGLLPLAEKVAPRKLRRLIDAVPSSPSPFHVKPGSVFSALGVQRGSVSLHLGCVDGNFFGEVLQHTIAVLNHQGFTVSIPAQPSCCGALEAHSGAADIGRVRGTETLSALSGFDAILITAAGCQAFLHELNPREKVMDPLEFLLQQGFRSIFHPLRKRIVYDPPCHKLFVLKNEDATPKVLRMIPELELLMHEEESLCCGAGGIAFLREAELTAEIGARKVSMLLASNPQVVVNANSGCRIQMESSLRAQGSGMTVMHPISLVHQALLGPD
ncbi:MAG: (Fe-S)-binding protein [Planctomycetota bacterium]